MQWLENFVHLFAPKKKMKDIDFKIKLQHCNDTILKYAQHPSLRTIVLGLSLQKKNLKIFDKFFLKKLSCATTRPQQLGKCCWTIL